MGLLKGAECHLPDPPAAAHVAVHGGTRAQDSTTEGEPLLDGQGGGGCCDAGARSGWTATGELGLCWAVTSRGVNFHRAPWTATLGGGQSGLGSRGKQGAGSPHDPTSDEGETQGEAG